jgi:hypothetical protein
LRSRKRAPHPLQRVSSRYIRLPHSGHGRISSSSLVRRGWRSSRCGAGSEGACRFASGPAGAMSISTAPTGRRLPFRPAGDWPAGDSWSGAGGGSVASSRLTCFHAGIDSVSIGTSGAGSELGAASAGSAAASKVVLQAGQRTRRPMRSSATRSWPEQLGQATMIGMIHPGNETAEPDGHPILQDDSWQEQ